MPRERSNTSIPGSAVTGYTLDEVRGKNPRILKFGQTSSETYRRLWETITAGGEWRGELQNKRKDGEFYWGSVSISPLLNEQGVITHFIGVQEDITERKRVEATLRQAKETAEAASRAKGEFLANVSHEIRTPMNAILGMTELTLDTVLTPEQRENLEIVKSATDSLLSIINDLLDFSKMEAGKLELDPVEFEPARRPRGHAGHARPAGPREGPRAGLSRRSRGARSAHRRPGAAAPDPRQPGRQRDQVHRAGGGGR